MKLLRFSKWYCSKWDPKCQNKRLACYCERRLDNRHGMNYNVVKAPTSTHLTTLLHSVIWHIYSWQKFSKQLGIFKPMLPIFFTSILCGFYIFNVLNLHSQTPCCSDVVHVFAGDVILRRDDWKKWNFIGVAKKLLVYHFVFLTLHNSQPETKMLVKSVF